MDIVEPRVERYVTDLVAGDHPVADEMERIAKERDFPIVDRAVGVTLEVLARSVGAQRVLELGSGYGYSAYWFARAVSDAGEVHMTERDEGNQRQAMELLAKADLADRVRSHVGDALELIDQIDGEFDVIFSDIDKLGYPDAWAKARERIRVGGMYLCDNVLWSGHVTGETEEDPRPDWTRAVLEHNESVLADERYRSTIIPTRDGVMAALRIG